MKKIGITGGIGAGKSLVCKVFSTLGIPSYSADERAKWLQNNDQNLKDKIISLLGPEVYQEDGLLNRAKVAGIVFKDSEKLKLLNSLVHPAVANDFASWCTHYVNKPFVLKEAALLFETGSYKQLDATILVSAPKELRIERVKSRDPQRSTEEIANIIDKQMPEERKKELANHLILNDNKHSVIQQCLKLLNALSE